MISHTHCYWSCSVDAGGVGHAHVQALRNLIYCQNFATSAFFGWTMVNLRSCTRRTVTVQHMPIGHTHFKRFFYNSEECVSLNIFECRYF